MLSAEFHGLCQETSSDHPGPRCGHTLTALQWDGVHRLVAFGGATALENAHSNATTTTDKNANANANANAKLCAHIVPRGVFFFKIGIFGCRTTTERDDDDDDDDGASASARDDETNEKERSDARDDERW